MRSTVNPPRRAPQARWLVAALGLLCCAAAPSPEEIAALGELKLVTGSWCPFECLDEDAGGLRGFINDIAEAVFHKHGIKTSTVFSTYVRGIELVRDNHAQVLIGIAKEDAPDLVFPELEQGRTDFTFYVRAGNPWRYSGVSSFELLRKVGTMQGYDYGELNAAIAAHPERIEALGGSYNARRNIQKLLAGRFDAIIHDSVVTDFELHRSGKAGQLVAAGSLSSVQRVYVAFSPKFAGSPLAARLMSEGTRELRESGELAAILKRYGLKDWHK